MDDILTIRVEDLRKHDNIIRMYIDLIMHLHTSIEKRIYVNCI